MRGNNSSTCSSTIIDVEMLENYLKTQYCWSFRETMDNRKKDVTSICKVKNRTGENVFDPVVVSIGPYHHDKKTLKAMAQVKWNLMDYILKINTKRTLRDYVKALKEVEHIARSYYGEEITMGSNEFVNMLLLDGFFILVFVCAIELNQNSGGFSMDEGNSDNEIIKPLQFNFARFDLLLFENQIPFFVLEIIYGLFSGEGNAAPAPSLSEKVSYYIEEILTHYPKSIKEHKRPSNFHHLLHLCHIYLKPSPNVDFHVVHFDPLKGQSQTVNSWCRASEYHIAGIEIKRREFNENNPHSLLDVKLVDNILEIPCFTIYENTLSFFKNLIAEEKANPNFGNDITAYIIFMSQLVMDVKDVSLLVSKDIIHHDLEDEKKVLDIFMRLREDINFDFMGKFYLRTICHNLEAFYRNPNRWRVWFLQSASAIVPRLA